MLRAHAETLDELCEVATRPMARSGRRFWLLAGALSILVLWALVAYGFQLIQGLGVAGYDDRSFWGIYEANLVSFIAVSYGGALVSAILRLTQAKWRAPITRLAEGMAVVSLVVGMTFALIHLGRPDRIWRMVVTPQLDSPIVWDFIVVVTYLAATLIFLYLPLIPDLGILSSRPGQRAARWISLYRKLSLGWSGEPEQRRLLDKGVTAIAILIIPLAVFVHSVLSWAFALTGRPGWDSTIFAPYFVVAAIYAGVAMVILVIAGFRRGYHLEDHIGLKQFRNLGYLLITLDLMYLYFTFTEMLTEGYLMNEATVPVLEALLLGQYAPFFWAFVVGGGIVPLLLLVTPRTRTVAGIVTASSLVVAGMWMKRLLIVVPVVAQPRIAGAVGSFSPTWVAVGVTVGAAAAIPLLLMLLFKVFPLLSIDEILEVAAAEDRPASIGRRAELTLSEGGNPR